MGHTYHKMVVARPEPLRGQQQFQDERLVGDWLAKARRDVCLAAGGRGAVLLESHCRPTTLVLPCAPRGSTALTTGWAGYDLYAYAALQVEILAARDRHSGCRCSQVPFRHTGDTASPRCIGHGWRHRPGKLATRGQEPRRRHRGSGC
jgi:hypothetical protein